jgi:hypothetical protein
MRQGFDNVPTIYVLPLLGPVTSHTCLCCALVSLNFSTASLTASPTSP